MTNLAKKTSQTTSHMPLLIGIDMAAGKDESVVRNINQAKYFADKAQRLLNKGDDENAHAIRCMVNSIMTLSMINSDVLHINVAYTPAAEELEVKVFASDTDYFQACKTKFSRSVYLDAVSTLEQLKALEDHLIDLVADAKDKAIGAC